MYSKESVQKLVRESKIGEEAINLLNKLLYTDKSELLAMKMRVKQFLEVNQEPSNVRPYPGCEDSSSDVA